MKCHILFSGKNNKNISKCHLLKILPRVLSLKTVVLLDAMLFCDFQIMSHKPKAETLRHL